MLTALAMRSRQSGHRSLMLCFIRLLPNLWTPDSGANRTPYTLSMSIQVTLLVSVPGASAPGFPCCSGDCSVLDMWLAAAGAAAGAAPAPPRPPRSAAFTAAAGPSSCTVT
jgi:hypothetical protein